MFGWVSCVAPKGVWVLCLAGSPVWLLKVGIVFLWVRELVYSYVAPKFGQYMSLGEGVRLLL